MVRGPDRAVEAHDHDGGAVRVEQCPLCELHDIVGRRRPGMRVLALSLLVVVVAVRHDLLLWLRCLSGGSGRGQRW